MVKKLLFYIVVAALGLWLATIFVPGVKVELLPDSNFFGINLTADWQIFLILGITLGLVNYFIKPILKIITLPLQIITLGLFSFIINMVLLWTVGAIFKELTVPLFYSLFFTTVIIWGLGALLSIFVKD